MVLNRRSVIPGVLTAAAIPAAAYALGARPAKGTLPDPASCEAASLHGEIREAALERIAEGVRPEDLMRLSHCPRCGCGTLADMPEDLLKSLGG